MNKRLLLGWSVLPTFVFTTVVSFAETQILLHEDFESYTNETELNEVWPKVGNAITHLAKDPENAENTVLFSRGDRRTRTFDSVKPTNDMPLRVSVDYYDVYKADVPGREYIGLWAGRSDPRALIEVGLHNHADSNSTRYTARVLEDEAGWFDLNTVRKVGWRKIQLLVFADTVEIYIDGDLDTVVDWAGGWVSAVRLGGGFGFGDTASLTGVYYDNLRVERVENPQEEGTVLELTELTPAPLSADPEV